MNKTIVILIASLQTLLGCTNREIIIEQVQEVTIQAKIIDESSTRSIRLENGDIWWTPGDQLSVFYGSGSDGGSRFTAQITENSRIANFTGTLEVITGGGEISAENTYFWGIYPYNSTASCDGSIIITDVPSTQTAVAGTFAPNTYPWIGRSQGLLMSFYGLCGGIKFMVNKEGVKKATLKSLDGSPLAGRVGVQLDANGIPSVSSIISGSDEVVLEAPDGEYFIPGQYYFFVTLPHYFSDSYFTIKFETFLEEGTYERTRSMEITRAMFNSFAVALDGAVTYTKKTGNIPVEDPAFKSYLVANYDSDSDGEISYSEAEAITSIELYPTNQYNLQSLRGIEYMPNLVLINCPGGWDEGGVKRPLSELSSVYDHYYIGPYDANWDNTWGPIGTLRYLDVSANPKLKYLWIRHNSALGVELGTLDLSNNPLLEIANMGMTWIQYPDVSSNTNLKELDLGHLRGDCPDISALINLERLWIDWPEDVRLENADDQVDIDISHMSNLKYVALTNRVKSLSNLSANPELEELHVDHCQFSGSLDVSSNSKLKNLHCENTGITSLSLNNKPDLLELFCIRNNLSSLDVSNCTKLQKLQCWDNNIGELSVSGLDDLELLECANCGLTALDVTHNPKLWKLSVNDNNLGSINLSGNPLLEELAIWNCGLSALDISANPEMTWLRCWGNQITSLNVSNNLKLGTRETTSPDDNGLWCAPMNTLTNLLIAEGQVIPNVTVNRSSQHIPDGTNITIAPAPGGGEGSGQSNETP